MEIVIHNNSKQPCNVKLNYTGVYIYDYVIQYIIMHLFHALKGYTNAILFSLFVASALYYLAELVEEYTVITGKIVKITIGVSKQHGKNQN